MLKIKTAIFAAKNIKQKIISNKKSRSRTRKGKLWWEGFAETEGFKPGMNVV